MKKHCFAIMKKQALFSFKIFTDQWCRFSSSQNYFKNERKWNKASYIEKFYVFAFSLLLKAKAGNLPPDLFFDSLHSFCLNPYKNMFLFTKSTECKCVVQIRNFNIYVNHNGKEKKKKKTGPPKSFCDFYLMNWETYRQKRMFKRSKCISLLRQSGNGSKLMDLTGLERNIGP